jgi:hypothetical protein
MKNKRKFRSQIKNLYRNIGLNMESYKTVHNLKTKKDFKKHLNYIYKQLKIPKKDFIKNGIYYHTILRLFFVAINQIKEIGLFENYRQRIPPVMREEIDFFIEQYEKLNIPKIDEDYEI